MATDRRIFSRADRVDELSTELAEHPEVDLGEALRVLEDDDDTLVRRLVRRRSRSGMAPTVSVGDPDTDETFVKPRIVSDD